MSSGRVRASSWSSIPTLRRKAAAASSTRCEQSGREIGLASQNFDSWNANGEDDTSTLPLDRGQGERARDLYAQGSEVWKPQAAPVAEKGPLISQEWYAAAFAAAGHQSGIDRMRACLDERLRVRGQDRGLAEVRWLAQDLQRALAGAGRSEKALPR